MTLADSAGLALAVTAVLAVAARLAGALTTGGTVAGAVVGACVSIGFGLPGLAVLGTFFVVGTLATRIGWEKKKARGTAEAGEGRRDWRRVVGKGGVAAALPFVGAALAPLALPGMWFLPFVFCGAVAAALADTMGTEVGTLASGEPRAVPSFRRVPTGTPGAVSGPGLAGAAVGAALVGAVAMWAPGCPAPETGGNLTLDPGVAPWHSITLGWPVTWLGLYALIVVGVTASLVESIAVGLGLRASGFVRNLLTTASGAVLAAMLWPLRGLLVA